MRLVRFLRRGFHDGHLREPGEEILVEDHVILSPHMLDVATGEAGKVEPPVAHQTAFRADLAYDRGGLKLPETMEEARAFGEAVGGPVGQFIDEMWKHIDELGAAIKSLTAARAQDEERPDGETHSEHTGQPDLPGAEVAPTSQDAPPAG